MKTFLFVIQFLIITSLVNSQSWQIMPTPTKQNLARLDMISNNNGWTVSYDGLILKYDGERWFISDSLQRIQKGFRPKGELSLTDIKDWGDIYTIRMYNSQMGWIAINNVYARVHSLVYYKNEKWQPWDQLLPIKIRAIDFFSESFGIAVGENGGFQFINGDWKNLLLPRSLDFSAVKIISPDNYFIAGENGVILHGGKDWKVYESDDYPLIRDIDFISDDEGWFVGNDGLILHYKSGDINQQLPETVNDFWAVDMLNNQTGYIVGKNGVILQYDGVNWNSIFSPTTADLHDIELIDSKTGWIVGAWGVFLHMGEKTNLTRETSHQFLFFDQVHIGSNYLMDRIDDVKGVSVADFNGDDLPDIYITCYRSLNHLLLNQGGGYFVDNVIESGTGGNIETRVGKQKYEEGSLLADFDRDGDTDIFLAGKSGTTKLFINDGNAIFKEVSHLFDDLDIVSGAVGDFNEDGYPDIFLADEKFGLILFENKKYNRFYEHSFDSLFLPQTGIRTISVNDFNHDTHSDILVFFNHSAPILLSNYGQFSWTTNYDLFCGYNMSDFVNSVTLADFNCDGFNDLFIATENGNDNMYIYNYQSNKFENQSANWQIKKGGRSYTGIANDFNNDGFIDLYLCRFGNDYLYMNENNQRFNEQAADLLYSKSGFIDGFNIGAASADIDLDGDIDIIAGNRDHWSSLLQNTTNDSNYIIIELLGTINTRECLGTKIWLYSEQKELIGFKEVNPASGLLSYNWNKIHFGLGNHKNVDLKIQFLDGTENIISGIQNGSNVQINESSYLVRLSYKINRTLLQYLHIPQIPFEVIKLFLFIVIIIFSVRFIEKRYQWRSSHTAMYVLILMTVYSILTFVLFKTGGIFYHILPFGTILFALIVLIFVNEQIRKATLRENFIRDNIQKASASLSQVLNLNKAISLIFRTINLIYPNNFFILYTYHPYGNYFLLKKAEGISLQTNFRKITIDRNTIEQIIRSRSPLSKNKFEKIWPDDSVKGSNSVVFPLAKKNDLLGMAIISIENDTQPINTKTIISLRFLFLQLTNTLSNIRMLNDMQDQQKLVAIGAFSSSIIHNLKNPIDGMRMIIEVLRNEMQENDPKEEYIKELHEGILKLKQDLLTSFDFVKYKEGKKDKFNINELIQKISTDFKKLNYPDISINLAKDINEIEGDKEQLYYAIENLVENALEASINSKPVQVSTRLNKSPKTVEIEIKDFGKGIPVEKLDKLFEIFYTTRGKGRGLGLTITRNIISSHNGYIDVNSQINKGTTFTVVLPLSQGQNNK